MSTPDVSSATLNDTGAEASRWNFRSVLVLGGVLAVVGSCLAAFVNPAWAGLAALGGLVLIFAPDRPCCGR